MNRHTALTADDVPVEPDVKATGLVCPNLADHPDEEGSKPGFGYAGGGFGAYRICTSCGSIFGKISRKDGNV